MFLISATPIFKVVQIEEVSFEKENPLNEPLFRAYVS